MKLLFDHNLSPRLVKCLADLYPDSNYLFNLNLDTAEDFLVWQYARDNDFIIVTNNHLYGIQKQYKCYERYCIKASLHFV
jgi:predicted nuclease of predicted toxin-antitoxin system